MTEIRTGRRPLAITDAPFTRVEVRRDDGTCWTTYTRSKPWALRSGIMVVYLVGLQTPCLLGHCAVVPQF